MDIISAQHRLQRRPEEVCSLSFPVGDTGSPLAKLKKLQETRTGDGPTFPQMSRGAIHPNTQVQGSGIQMSNYLDPDAETKAQITASNN